MTCHLFSWRAITYTDEYLSTHALQQFTEIWINWNRKDIAEVRLEAIYDQQDFEKMGVIQAIIVL